MKQKIKKPLQFIFSLLVPILKPVWAQKTLIKIGVRIPYHGFAEKLNYRGLVEFEINNKKIFLQSNNQPIDIFIFWYGIFGVWEPTQVKLWAQLVKESDLVLDVGANTGVYSLIASTNSHAEIYAFEPVPVVRKMLLENIRLNNATSIKVEETLVGASVGEQTLYIPRQGWVDVASIEKDFAMQYLKKDTMEEITCPITTLDTFIGKFSLKPTTNILCKIDVEGAEHHVLQGMQQTLKRNNIHFTVELLDKEYFSKVIALIPPEYRLYAIDEKQKTVYLTSEFTENATNYLVTKKEIILQ